MELPVLSVLMAAVLGYFFGSIPFGLVSSFFFGLGDIRKIGSGNIGATNVLRTGNKKAALVTLILDASKGALAVLIVPFLLSFWSGHPRLLSSQNDEILALTIGCFAFLGHIYPFWLKFQGGKGVATFLGLQFALNGFWVGLLSCAYWLIGWKCSSISSVGAITTAILTPMTLCVMNAQNMSSTQAGLVHSAMAILLIFRHHSNIKRLLQGKEPKSGKKSADKPAEPVPTPAPEPAPVVMVVPEPTPTPVEDKPDTPDVSAVAAAVVAGAIISELVSSEASADVTPSETVAVEPTSVDSESSTVVESPSATEAPSAETSEVASSEPASANEGSSESTSENTAPSEEASSSENETSSESSEPVVSESADNTGSEPASDGSEVTTS